MEFYYENKLLSETLPEGYYKNMYGSFTPTKLTLSSEEVKKYWEENPKEFDWARDELLSVPFQNVLLPRVFSYQEPYF